MELRLEDVQRQLMVTKAHQKSSDVADRSADPNRALWICPGQGSFHRGRLRELYLAHRELRKLFYVVDIAAGTFLGAPLLPALLDTAEPPLPDPDLDQLGIYLANVATARLWLAQGQAPAALAGHSFGELAALAIAGVYDDEIGARIVCDRVLSLRQAAGAGRMMALSGGVDAVARLIRSTGTDAAIAVVNHQRQTVVSGADAELDRLANAAVAERISATRLQSRYPFHSRLLAPASRTFRAALSQYRFRPPTTPVMIGTERRWLDAGMDVADILARQLTTPLDFPAQLSLSIERGITRVVECGAGDMVSKIAARVLHDRGVVVSVAAAHASRRDSTTPAAAVSPPPRASVAQAAPVPTPAASPKAIEGTTGPEPIAIVGMGCVLPGSATNPAVFWQHILDGVNGIVDLTVGDPHAREDFVAGDASREPPQIVPDKTYTLLNGSIPSVSYDTGLLASAYDAEEFSAMTKGQRLLATALAQALDGAPASPAQRAQCIIGSTADGVAELDEAHFAESIREAVHQLPLEPQASAEFEACLSRGLAGWSTASDRLRPYDLYASVAERLAGVPAGQTYLVDSACSSSLYSITLGARALRAGEADVVYAGGVFAPGPANNNLFAQFRGLTPTGSRPLDMSADGVVFGDGAGVVVLKRLSVALEAGHKILAVLRTDGASSDGKSPSINVPQADGQAVAMQAAYQVPGVEPESIQYVEAHATATPVGDAVEFKALCRAFPPKPSGGVRWLGSVKSLIGHTGWTSGVASVIKLCQALAHRQIPRQYGFSAPNPQIELTRSGFAIPQQHEPWRDNDHGWPRRAAINSFGFGGTNAHVVLEEFVEPYHRALAEGFRKPMASTREPLVIVGVSGLFPDDGQVFDRTQLRMPKKRMVLPDVAEHMDASQYLATMAAEQLSAQWPAEVTGRGGVRIGVALGLEAKTERGVRANERIFLDRLSRVARDTGASTEAVQLIRDAVTRRVMPSGPYSLPGLMPNVSASRITHTFNWRGPNIVIDQGTGSLAQALHVASAFVRADDCDVMLAGAVHAWRGHAAEQREAAVLVGLATEATANRLGLRTLARLTDGQAPDAVMTALDHDVACRGAAGARVLYDTLVGLATQPIGHRFTVGGEIRMGLAPVPHSPSAGVVAPSPSASETHAYVQGTPIVNYTPVLVPAPEAPATPAVFRRCLFVVDQADVWDRWRSSGALQHLSWDVVAPLGVAVEGAISIDASTEATLAASLAPLAAHAYDGIIALHDVSASPPDALLQGDFAEHRRWLDLVFALARDRYEPLGRHECALLTLCTGAWRGDHLDPWTGLAAGLTKSVARERPGAVCRAIATDATDPVEVWAQLLGEASLCDGLAEVAYRSSRRMQFSLTRSEPLHRAGAPWVGPGAVIIATGGGRGVTAVLAEWLVQQGPCTVIALGRTDPNDLPEDLRALSPEQFNAGETAFYQRERARDASRKMPELKRRFEQYQAAHEVASVMARTRHAPGTYRYELCDINDRAAVTRLISNVMKEYGRLDMVIHGAGVQVSKMLPRKTLGDFQRIVSTKLESLSHIYHACEQVGLAGRVHMHLLTSAFSYLGNDGQPDYGAANEAMNRLASCLNSTDAYWSSFAWLGWAGIGMTRGSEYAALAANRRLRGVTREEGQKLFADAVAGPPADPVNVILADGELAFYRPHLVSARPGMRSITREWMIGPETMPFLGDHTVRGVPTVPGAFLIAMAGDAALALCPSWKIQQFERTRFVRLVRANGERAAVARVIATVVESRRDEIVVQAHVVMDFIHKSGRVLGTDLLHTEIFVRLRPTLRSDRPERLDVDGEVVRLPDPYVLPGSPVQLDGVFRAMPHVDVSASHRVAPYQWPGRSGEPSDHDALLPTVILVDAFWRFGTVQACGEGRLGVYVPERCDVMKVFFDWADYQASPLREAIVLSGANPRPEGDVLHVGPITAFDVDGRPLLQVEGGLCRKFGELAVGDAG